MVVFPQQLAAMGTIGPDRRFGAASGREFGGFPGGSGLGASPGQIYPRCTLEKPFAWNALIADVPAAGPYACLRLLWVCVCFLKCGMMKNKNEGHLKKQTSLFFV